MEKKARLPTKKLAIGMMTGFAALFVFSIVVMIANSSKPDSIDLGAVKGEVQGNAFIKTNRLLIEQLADNWLPNDILWPTVFLDNMPNYQIGELEVVRYNTRVLRDNLSRMRTTDKLDPSAEKAFTALSNDPYKWWFPSAESKWKLSYKALVQFEKDLAGKKAHFYPRADNLAELLSQYASLMGGVNTRLIHAPRDINKVLALDTENGKLSEEGAMVSLDIPWHKLDDNFYYAQGAAYALLHSFRAIRIDFIEVLEDKNSVKLVDKIIEDLRRCDFEPLFVFNGDPDSIFANHSLNLSGMFNDARQKINSLIVALKQG